MFITELKKEIDALNEERATLAAERVALKDESVEIDADEKRDVASKTARVDEILARNDAIQKRDAAIVADVTAKQARVDQLEALAAERAAAPTFIRKPEAATNDDLARMNVAQLIEATRRNIGENDLDTDQATKLLKRHRSDLAWVRNIAARSTAAYASAFAKMMTDRGMFLTDEERAAIAVGTNTQGGLLVPTHLDPTLILTNSGSSNAIRAISRQVTLTNSNTWNGVTTAGSDFSWDAELAEVSDDSPTFVAAGIPTFVGAGFIQASYQAFEDIENLGNDVMMLFADGRDRLEGTAHATGNGTTQPQGIFTACDANTNVEVTSTTAATIGLVDLQGLRRAVPVRYRNRATWVMNPVYADAIAALGTAVSASYTTNLTEAPTTRLIGLPVVETDDAPSTQTTTVKDNEIVVGDFSQYVIVDKPGSTTLDFIPNLFNTTTNLPDGRRGWYMRFRSGAEPTNVLAFRLLQDKTSA